MLAPQPRPQLPDTLPVRSLMLFLVTVLLLVLLPQIQLLVPTLPISSSAHAPVTARDFGKLPLLFVANQGQTDPQVDFYVQGSDKTLFFTSEGMTIVLPGAQPAPNDPRELPGLPDAAPPSEPVAAPTGPSRWVVKLDFVGARPDVQPIGEDRAETVISHFTGRPDQWHTSIPTFGRLVYPDLWPGIDLVYYGSPARLKYEFIVHPGADPNQIRLTYRGTSGVSVNQTGQLEVTTSVGGFRDDTPVSYQMIDGERQVVATHYALSTPDTDGSVGYGFVVGNYDPQQTLVIDPAMLIYSGYIGPVSGNSNDRQDIAVDSTGNVYVTGHISNSGNGFPATIGPDLDYNGGSSDVFVAKMRADGSALIYAGFIGGSAGDYGDGIAVDASGNAYIVGTTDSSEGEGFPVTIGPDLEFNGGTRDAFVAKVRPDGTGLVYAGYIGGNDNDWGYGIDIDATGNAYVTGATSSSPTDGFPVAVGPSVSREYDVYDDAFVAKVRADGTALDYAGYIGGRARDVGYDIAVDAEGNAYITGFTQSSEISEFPVIIGPDLFNNGTNTFVAKVRADGSALVYSGFIDGSGGGNGIAVDAEGNAYVVGNAMQTVSEYFPATVGPDLTFNGGETDAFVAKIRANGSGFVYAGYIGGSNGDHGEDIAVDALGNAYVVGETSSSESQGFPVADGPDLSFNGENDAFVAKIRADGSQLDYAGYIGGTEQEHGYGIAVDFAGSAYVVGWTRSSEAEDFPIMGGTGVTHPGGGSYYAFVAKISTGLAFSTYFGGSRTYFSGLTGDVIEDIAIDDQGYIYVTGVATSEDFPTTEGAYDRSFADTGTHDVGGYLFVAKFTPDASELIYSTYIGGSRIEYSPAIAVDQQGNAYVTGQTASPDFPTTAGALRTELLGIRDSFVLKLNPSGSALAYSTYLGGGSNTPGEEDGSDKALAIAVNDQGEAFVTGWTNNHNFSTTEGAFQEQFNGDAENSSFIARLNSSGTDLIFSTFLNGTTSGDDVSQASGIAIDEANNSYVVGQACGQEFPTTVGAFRTVKTSQCEGFLTKLNPTGTALVFSTYTGPSQPRDVIVDSSGHAYITGSTGDYGAPLPVTNGAYDQTFNGGNRDAYVMKFAPDGSALVYSTYIGGNDNEEGMGIAVNPAGQAFITGMTTSRNFPLSSDAFQTSRISHVDPYLVQLDEDGASLLYSSYVGWADYDPDWGSFRTDMALHPSGHPIIAGSTNSSNFPTTAGSYDPTYNGTSYGSGWWTRNGFIAQVLPDGVQPPGGTDCARFVDDLNYPDGTIVNPGQTFNKGWRMENCGTANWSGYRAVRISGNYGPETFAISSGAPGAIVEITTDVTAPTTPGTYRAIYKLEGPNGLFGDAFWVEVKVREYSQARFSISGRVTVDGVGIDGAVVRTNSGESATSDAQGFYEIANLRYGNYQLSASRAGYLFPDQQDVTLPPAATGIDFTGEEVVPEPKQKIAIIVHGWQGFQPNPSVFTCKTTFVGNNTPVYIEGSTPPGWGVVGRTLTNAGYTVYLASWTTSTARTIRAEDAARDCLAPSIASVIDQDDDGKVLLVAHSMGGLVSRAYIEGPNYSGDVERLITMGTPHVGVNINTLVKLVMILQGGSSAKDVICTINPGLCQLGTDQMVWFNLMHHPRADVRYDFIGGRGGPWYLGWLEGTEGPHDGIVGDMSATGYPSGPGRLLAADGPLVQGSNIGRWYSYSAHTSAFPRTFVDNRPWYFDDIDIVFCTRSLLGLIPTAECNPNPLPRPAQAPNQSTFSTTPLMTGTIQSGEIITETLAIDGANTDLLLGWQTGQLHLTLTTPDGTAITATNVAQVLPGAQYQGPSGPGDPPMSAYSLPNPPAGRWVATIAATDVFTETTYALFAALQSPLTLSVDRPSSVAPGQAFTVSATLSDLTTPVDGATVTASLPLAGGPQEVTLTRTAPGVYTGQFSAPATAGPHILTVTAAGSAGKPFARQVDELITVRASGVQRQGVPTVATVDQNGNGRFEALRVAATYNTASAGDYAGMATLQDASGRAITIARTNATWSAGVNTLIFEFDGGEILAGGVDGPYRIVAQVVARGGLQLVVDEQPLLTGLNYQAVDFEADEGDEAPQQQYLYLPLLRR